jgi:hypothetical protein
MSLPFLPQPKRVYVRIPKTLPILSLAALYGLTFHRVITEYVNIPYTASLKPANFSAEVFVKSTDTVNAPCALFNPYGTSYSGAWHLRIDSSGVGYVIVYTSAGNILLTGAKVTDGRWHRLGGFYDGTTGGLVVDRTITTQVLAGSINYDTQPLWVGIRSRSGTLELPFNGQLALVKVYNRRLTAAEWDWNLQNPVDPVRSGLVLWLPMIEGVGTVVNDYSGLGNNGAVSGGVAWYEMAQHEPQADIL